MTTHFTPLHNIYSPAILLGRIQAECFRRRTLSFYRYFYIEDPTAFRNLLYAKLDALDCHGRIYVAHEGINAQMNVPEPFWQSFLAALETMPGLEKMPLKIALEQKTGAFLKLTVKVREKLVADGLANGSFDTTNVGKHLSPTEFNEAMALPGTVVVDMRNRYESEVGHFEGAILPNVDTFEEELPVALQLLEGKASNKVLLYCTGGIRCEKASAYLKHHGFTDVNQLHGGIIAYAQEVKEHGLENKFQGKNFVFDERLGERVSAHVVAHCHQCGTPADTHHNCANAHCHLLTILCKECHTRLEGTCSDLCFTFVATGMPPMQPFPGKLAGTKGRGQIIFSGAEAVQAQA